MRDLRYVILAAVMLIILLLLTLPVRLEIRFKKNSPQSLLRADLTIGFWRRTLLPKQKKSAVKAAPAPKTAEKRPVSEQIRAVLALFSQRRTEIVEILDYASRHAARFEEIRFHMTYSTADAAATGILCGVINGAVYGILGAIHQRSELAAADIGITPDFGAARLELDAGCIVRLKNVHIIVITVKLIKLALKTKRQAKGK